jgi:hypothetical protein
MRANAIASIYSWIMAGSPVEPIIVTFARGKAASATGNAAGDWQTDNASIKDSIIEHNISFKVEFHFSAGTLLQSSANLREHLVIHLNNQCLLQLLAGFQPTNLT